MPTPVVPNITPQSIDASRLFWEAFGSIEADAEAAIIVQFCQQRGKGWEPVGLADLEMFMASMRPRPTIRRLVRMNYVVVHGGEMYIMAEFVLRCHQASPR